MKGRELRSSGSRFLFSYLGELMSLKDIEMDMDNSPIIYLALLYKMINVKFPVLLLCVAWCGEFENIVRPLH